jgi:hypothetical protein
MLPSTTSGKVVLGLLASSLWLGWTTTARAEMMDARSLSMGGARAANAMGTAFGPLYNPAAIGGNWSMILPGASVGLGNNVIGIGQISQITNLLGGQGGSNLLTGISGLVGNLGTQTSRIEATVGVPIIGFNGHPFPLQVQGSPVDFGFNLYVNGGANVVLSGTQGMLGLFSNSAQILNNVSALQTAVSTGPAQLQTAVTQAQAAFTGLQGLNPTDPTSVATVLNSSVTALETLNTQLNQVLSPVQSAATSVTTALAPFGTTAQRLGLTAAADGHLTLAITGKATVLKTTLLGLPFSLNVGTNLKGFIMPQVAAIPSLVGSLTGQTGATDKVPPVAATVAVETNPLASIASVTSTVTNANQVITGAQSTFANILTSTRAVRDQANVGVAALNAGNVAGAAAAMQQVGSSLPGLITTVQSASQTIPAITGMVNGLGGIQQNLTTDLQNIKLKATSFSEVSPVGVGADIGATAQLGDEITVGASLDNLFVLWPGKQRVTTLTLNTSGGAPFKADPTTPETTQSSNYDLTEPRALRLGGTYKPTKVPGLTVAADVEQVFNGRPFAAHIGGEFRVANVVGLRLGGQLGGLGNMVTGGAGIKAGPFNADIGVGSDFSRAAQGAVNFSLAF